MRTWLLVHGGVQIALLRTGNAEQLSLATQTWLLMHSGVHACATSAPLELERRARAPDLDPEIGAVREVAVDVAVDGC